MKLFWGSKSPYVRKVVVAAANCGLTGRIERTEVFPWDADTAYGAVNPVGKVPALVTNGSRKLIPPAGEARLEAMRIVALGDGMMDAVILRYGELERRSKELYWDFWDDRMSIRYPIQ